MVLYKFSDGRSIKLIANQTLLLKPTDKYKIICDTNSTHYTINFNLSNESIEGEIAKSIFLSKDNPILNVNCCKQFKTIILVLI